MCRQRFFFGLRAASSRALFIASLVAGCGGTDAPADVPTDARADVRDASVDARDTGVRDTGVRDAVADARDAPATDAPRDVTVRADAPDVVVDVETPDDIAEVEDVIEDLVRPDDVPPFEEGVVTFAGSGDPGLVNGLRVDARFYNPVNVAVSPSGDVYVADFGNNSVRKIEPDGWVTTFVRQAGFEAPFGLAFAPDGTLYIETDANDRGGRSNSTGTIWRVPPGERTAEVIARDLGRPRGLVVLPDGRLAMSDYVLHIIETLDPNDGRVSLLAGSRGRAGSANGDGAAARFNRPYGMALRGDGSLVVADQGSQRIRVVTAEGAVSTLAGSGAAGAEDGPGETAQFNGPQGLAINSLGVVFVSEADGHRVRQIAPDGTVSTLAGDGVAGCVDGALDEAEFYGLEGLAISPDDLILYLPDGNRGTGEPYHRMRRLLLPLPD